MEEDTEAKEEETKEEEALNQNKQKSADPTEEAVNIDGGNKVAEQAEPVNQDDEEEVAKDDIATEDVHERRMTRAGELSPVIKKSLLDQDDAIRQQEPQLVLPVPNQRMEDDRNHKESPTKDDRKDEDIAATRQKLNKTLKQGSPSPPTSTIIKTTSPTSLGLKKRRSQENQNQILDELVDEKEADLSTPSPIKKTFSDKEDERQRKSGAVTRRSGTAYKQNKDGEDIPLPGSFSVVSHGGVENPIPQTDGDTERQQQSMPSTTNMIEATLVDPIIAEANIIEPQPDEKDKAEMEERDRKRRQRRCIALFLTNGVIVTLVVVLLVYFLTNRDDDDDYLTPSVAPLSTPNPTSPGTFAPTVENKYNFPESTWNAVLSSPDSAHARAYRWLLEDVPIFDPENTLPEWRYWQRYALAVLYFSTGNADGSEGWFQDGFWLDHAVDECRWKTSEMILGETITNPCFQEDQEVTGGIVPKQYFALGLSSNNLRGTIPPELFIFMPSLRKIDLSKNKLTGTLPTGIESMTPNLEVLMLNSNMLEGTLPEELLAMTQLWTLNLEYNNFHGRGLSSSIGKLFHLRYLNLSHNKLLSGTLPQELSLLRSLEIMQLQDNRFNGTLPSIIGTVLSKTSILLLHENNFSGPLPSELGLMTGLTEFRLNQNSFTSALPTEVGQLTKLVTYTLAENNFTSPIPSELGALTKLKRLRMEDNQFTSFIPSEVGLLSDMIVISVQRNQLRGSISSDLGRMRNLKRLLLHENMFEGSIPTELFDLSLTRLLLYDNQLTGAIPSEIGNFRFLEDCWIGSNAFNGTLPSTMAQLTSLLSLHVNNTMLRGTIPTELELLTKLQYATFASNPGLSRTVPDGLCRLNQSQLLFDCSDQLCGCGYCECPVLQAATSTNSPLISVEMPSTSPTQPPPLLLPTSAPTYVSVAGDDDNGGYSWSVTTNTTLTFNDNASGAATPPRELR